GIAIALIKHDEDENDHNIPKVVWYGIEPLILENPSKFLALAAISRIPLVTQYIARRAVDEDESHRLVALIGMQENNTEDLLAGMLSGMEGRTDLNMPPNWKSVAESLQHRDGNVVALAMKVSGLFGDQEATQLAFTVLKNKEMPADQRKNALRMLASQQQQQLVAELPGLVHDPAMRK